MSEEQSVQLNTEETLQDTGEAIPVVDEIPLIDLNFEEPYRITAEDIRRKEKSKRAGICPELFFVGLFVLLELFFHLFRLGATGENLLYKLLFAAFYGLVFGTVVSLCSKKAGVVVCFFLASLSTVYFLAQLIYSGVFDTYLSLSGTLEVAGQALDFTDVIWKAVSAEWWKLLLLLCPLGFGIFLAVKKKLNFLRHGIKQYAVQLAICLLLFFGSVLLMKVTAKELYSPYEVYKHYTSVNMSVEKLGVMESLYLDTKEGLKNRLGIEDEDLEFAVVELPVTTEEELTEAVFAENTTESAHHEGSVMTIPEVSQEEKELDTSPNVLDIDLDALIEQETNANIRSIHEYVKAQTPTRKNEYTGMFEGYNLIFVVAEGFTGYVVDAKRTPMLYKMSTEGFYFKNYYTPLWYGSTLGGEYADLTGLMPKNGSYLSMSRAGSRGNDMYFTLSSQLLRQGYSVRGYHDNDYTYYDRNISHPNMGYDWKGMDNGLTYERENGSALWPQSDLSMIENTFDDYVNDQPFHTYYLTVSGHVMYNYGGNAMARRHWDLVENLNYSETTKAYIACQYELELAMEALVEKLEKAGVADRTLIVLTADHVPYDNKEVVDELSGRALDKTFGWYKNRLIIWSASMKEPVVVDKCCSSLDILPTVSNLMGLPYDSRMLVGRDILSDEEGLVIFNDRSFLTDYMSYNANTGEVKCQNGVVVGDDYVEAMKTIVKNKFSMADAINENNYYKYIHEAVDKANPKNESDSQDDGSR